MSEKIAIRSSRDSRMLARAHEAFATAQARLTDEERARLDRVPLARLVAALDAAPPTARIAAIGPMKRVLDDVQGLGGEAWIDRYVRLVMLVLLVRTLARPASYRVPATVDELLAADFERIITNGMDGAAPYQVDGDLVLDLGLCRGSLLPFGIQYGQLPFEVNPAVLERGGLAHMPCSPWLNMHLRESMASEMNRDSRADMHMRVGQFMAENPAYQGLFGVTWWNDPVVAEISPHLAYITEQNQSAGAHVFRMDTADGVTVEHATSTSKTRRRLYEEGRYTPTDYAILFLRDDLMRWAEQRAAQFNISRRETSGSAER